jgi:hypothetical protein
MIEISHFHARFIAMFMLYLTGLLSPTLRDYDDDCYPQVRDSFLTFLVLSFVCLFVCLFDVFRCRYDNECQFLKRHFKYTQR